MHKLRNRKGDQYPTYQDVVGTALGSLYDARSIGYLMRDLGALHQELFGKKKNLLRSDAFDPRAARERADGVIPGPYAAFPGTSTSSYGRVWDPFLGVACADSDNPANPRAWVAAGKRADRRSPWFGAAWTWASSGCAGWPASTKADRFTGPYDVTTDSPVLVVGNSYDPATPLHGARAANRLLDGSRLLVMDGWGHGAIGTGPCIGNAYRDYLVDGTLPAAGTVCEPKRELFPKRR